MIAKIILFTCLVVAICEAGKHYKESFLEEICVGPDAPKCKETAIKCFETHDKSAGKFDNFKEEKCKTFEACLDQVAGTRATYATFIKEKRGGKDWCATKSGDHSGTDHHRRTEGNNERKEKFEDFLTKASGAAVTTEFKCCIAKGSGKFNADGKVNVAEWKKNTARIEDAAAKKAFETAIDSCAAAKPACSIHDFKICAVKKCYESIKGTN